MRITTFLTFFLLLMAIQVSAYNELDFKRHTFELSVGTGVDHQFIVRKYKDPVMGQNLKDSERPFVGFCFRLNYIYRPIRRVGISTGFESLEYGNKPGKTESYNVLNPYGDGEVIKGYGFNGSIGVPVYLHTYQQLGGIELEFITGPEFFFDVYSIANYQITDYSLLPFTYNFHTTQYLNNTQIKQSASLAWSVQLLADIPVKKAFVVSIGPEWKFLDIKQLAAGNGIDYAEPRTLPFFLGVKVGFRLGSDFWKKQKGA